MSSTEDCFEEDKSLGMQALESPMKSNDKFVEGSFQSVCNANIIIGVPEAKVNVHNSSKLALIFLG